MHEGGEAKNIKIERDNSPTFERELEGEPLSDPVPSFIVTASSLMSTMKRD